MDPLTRFRNGLYRLRHGRARRRAVQEFRRSLALIVDLPSLEASVSSRLKEIFDPDCLAILHLDPQAAKFRLSLSSGYGDPPPSTSFPAHGRLARWFVVNQSCLLLPRDLGVLAYLDPEERTAWQELGIQLGAPLITQNHLIGMLLLGSRRAGRQLTRADAELLLTLAEQASLAFHNAALYREQQDRLDRLHRADRLAAIGQLAAGVAHEVRNPLTAIRSTMQYLGKSFPENDGKHEMVSELLAEVDRIDRTITDLLSLTRSGELQPTSLDLVELVRQTAHLIAIQARQQGVEIELAFAAQPLWVRADAQKLKQVLLNLILNALQAMPEGGHIRLRIVQEVTVGSDAPMTRVEVTDQGPGIPPEQLSKVRDPFYTTKREGTGLGLAICQNIVERHAGTLLIDSTPGQGTTVTVLLPLRPAG